MFGLCCKFERMARTIAPAFQACRMLSNAGTKSDVVMNVFDRKAKRLQRDYSASLEDYNVYDYVKEEIGYRLSDRVGDIPRQFDTLVDLGCGRGYVSKHLLKDNVKTIYQCELSEKMLMQSEMSPEVPTHRVLCDEEFLPFKDNSIDIFTSSLSLHWVNDLPGCFKQAHMALKPDGVFLGCMFGGDTLFELRVSLMLAELEREGEGVEFMSRAVEGGDPFLMVMSFLHPHTALRVSKEFEGRSRHGIYGDAVEEMDWSVGKLLEHLDRLGERDNTLVMFISDHGAHLEQGTLAGSNGIFRGGKSHGAPEGAIRVPWVIRWPQVVPSGVTIDKPVSLMDLFPMVGHAAGVALPKDRQIDGKNILQLLQGREKVSPHEFLFHYCGDRLHATRYRPNGDSCVNVKVTVVQYWF